MIYKTELSDKQKAMAERWGTLTAPIRPSKEVVDLYKRNIIIADKNNSNSIWGILGCTPEIRSIAGKYQVKITCIDHNPDAFYAYEVLSKPSIYEEYLFLDWRNLDFKEMFDIVLGDGSMSMIPIKDHPIFLKNLHNIIKIDGYAILKIYVLAPLLLDSTQKIFEWYRKKKDGTPIRILRQYLYPLWLNLNTLNMSDAEYQTNLLEVYQDGLITLKEYEELDFIKNPGVKVQYTKKDVFEQLVSNYFEIVRVDYAGDYPLSNVNPVYLLRKK